MVDSTKRPSFVVTLNTGLIPSSIKLEGSVILNFQLFSNVKI